MPRVLGALNEGRAAFWAGRWQEAFDVLREVDTSSPLRADDLESLAASASWICRIRNCIAVRERALAAYLEAGHPREAAMVALALCFSSCRRGEAVIAASWLAPGERLLEAEPEAASMVASCGPYWPWRGAISTLHLRAPAELLARYVDGAVLIKQGWVSDRIALLDEAMLAAVQGHPPPMAIGEIYCNLVDACYEPGDLRRAGE